MVKNRKGKGGPGTVTFGDGMKQPPVGTARPSPCGSPRGMSHLTHQEKGSANKAASPQHIPASLGEGTETGNTWGRAQDGQRGTAGTAAVRRPPQGNKGGMWGEGTAGGTAPHPLPGFLQVAAEDFPDFLLLVLGQGWDDAFLREGFGADVPARTDSAQSHGATAHSRAEGLLAPRPLTGSTGQLGTHWMETAEMVEGILPKPPLSTSSIACFISIL